MRIAGSTLRWLLVLASLSGLVLLLATQETQTADTDRFLGWVAVVALEAIFFDIFVQYWAEGALPLPASSGSNIISQYSEN